MLSSDTSEFLNNWKNKVSNITGDDLDAVYRRFNDLYIIYSRLCNETSDVLIGNGTILQKGGDERAATVNAIRYLSADLIIGTLDANGGLADIEAIINVLPHFSIKFTQNGDHEVNIDLQLRNDLASGDNNIKALAVLKVIYYVRCNFFHSRKDFQEYQRLLVEPLNSILQTMNNLLESELSK